MIGELLRSRIRQRLDELGINPFEAERRANLKRGYLNDLLIEKKSTLREKTLPSLAKALECNVDFLTGRSDQPHGKGIGEGGVEIEGILEAGAWRSVAKENWSGERIPVTLDPRFDPAKQLVFLVRDDHAAGLGVTSGSVVLVLENEGPYRDGDIVVARRWTPEKIAETSIRVISGGALSARPAKGELPSYPLGDVEVLGSVISAIRIFGEPH